MTDAGYPCGRYLDGISRSRRLGSMVSNRSDGTASTLSARPWSRSCNTSLPTARSAPSSTLTGSGTTWPA